jgi:hypothetical protein
MRTPKDINVVSVLITSDGVPKFDYLGRVLPDGTVALPATLAVVEAEKPDAEIRIRVIAFQEQKARVLRDVLTTVPHQQTSLLRLPLNFLDDGSAINGTIPTELVPRGRGGAPEGITTFQSQKIQSSCDFDGKHQTSINGTCALARIEAATLPAFEQEAVYGDAGLQASGAPAACFDVARCFATSAPLAGVDMQMCTAPVPAGADPATMNLALVTPSTGECLAPGQCYVPLESDPSGGSYTVAGGVIKMAHGVCNKLAAGVKLYVSSDCPAIAPSSPVCEPTTPAAVDASTFLEGAAGEAGSACDGSYVVTCFPTGSSCGGNTGGSAGLTASGTQATLFIPDHGGMLVPGTVDLTTCVATFSMPPPSADSGSSDAGDTCSNNIAMITADLKAGAKFTVPCSGTNPDGTCALGSQSCSAVRGVFDAGAIDAAPPSSDDATVFADSGTTGVASVNGTVSGIKISPVDEGAAVGRVTGSYGAESLLAVVVSDVAGACMVQQQATGGGAQKASSTQVVLALAAVTDAPIQPGSYPINSAGAGGPLAIQPGQTWAFGSIVKSTSACGFSPGTVTANYPDSQATGGTIVVTQVSSTSVSGTFVLTFNGGDLSGSFSAPVCNGVDLQNAFAVTSPSAPGPDSNGICYQNIVGSDAGADASGGLPDASTDAPPVDAGPPTDAGSSDGGSGGDSGVLPDSGGPADASAAACFPLPAGAISWWRAEGDGSDLLGNNPATWTGAATYSPGEVGNAFDFAGASYLASGVVGVNAAAGGTAEGWVMPFTVPTGTGVDLFGFTGTGTSMDGGGLFAMSAGSTWLPEFRFAGQTVQSPNPLQTSTWNHIAVTWSPQVSDGGDAGDAGGIEDITLYVNGTAVASGPISYADAGVPTGFLIGGDGLQAADFTGLLDEVTLYSNPLPVSMLQGIYSAGPGGKCQCMTNTDCPGAKPTCNLGTHICQ